MNWFTTQREIDLELQFKSLEKYNKELLRLNKAGISDYRSLKESYDKKVGDIKSLERMNEKLDSGLKKESKKPTVLTTVKTFDQSDPAYLRKITNIAASDEFCFVLAVQREGFLLLMSKATTPMERDTTLGMIQGLDRLKMNLINHAERFEEVSHEQTV